MEKALEEDDTGDGKDRANLHKEKIDQHVAVKGEAMLKKGEVEKLIEHGDSRPLEESNTHERNNDKMDDTEELVGALGSSSDICIATPSNHRVQRFL